MTPDAHLLIVDDDERIRTLLQKFLIRNGFLVSAQISDAVNQLDKFTQENASIADETNSISQKTNQIAQTVVEDVNKNVFDGKIS